MNLYVECSFCDRRLDEIHLGEAEVLLRAAIGTAVGHEQLGDWHIYLTGTYEPTVICDRCYPLYRHAAAAIEASLDQVLERMRSG